MKLKSILFISLAFSLPFSVAAEDVDTIFKKVNEYIGQKNFPKALKELEWAKKEISQMHNKKLETFFPNEIAGFKGSDIEINSVLGMSNIEKKYKNGSNSLTVSMTGGGNAGGGMAAFGRMAAMMGTQAGQESFRIEGLTANIQKSGSRTELTVFLEGGEIFKIESRQEGPDKLKEVAKAINLPNLNNYLKGAS